MQGTKWNTIAQHSDNFCLFTKHWKCLLFGLQSILCHLFNTFVKTTVVANRGIPNHCLASNYMFKVNNGNTRTRFELRSNLTIKTPVLSLLLTLNTFHTLFKYFYFNFEQVNAGCVKPWLMFHFYTLFQNFIFRGYRNWTLEWNSLISNFSRFFSFILL